MKMQMAINYTKKEMEQEIQKEFEEIERKQQEEMAKKVEEGNKIIMQMNNSKSELDQIKIRFEETNVYLNEITIIFKPIGDNGQPLEPVVVKCRPNDLVAYIIEQYRKKSGDKSRYKKFIFDDFNLFPGMTIANSGLYNNAEIYVYKNNE